MNGRVGEANVAVITIVLQAPNGAAASQHISRSPGTWCSLSKCLSKLLVSPPPPSHPQAREHKENGNYEAARRNGKYAVWLNILAYVSGPILYIAAIIVAFIYGSVSRV